VKLRFFSINALDPEADQNSLESFCNGHRLVAIDKHFVIRSDVCYWSVLWLSGIARQSVAQSP